MICRINTYTYMYTTRTCFLTTNCFPNIEIHIIMSELVTETNVIPFFIAETISYMNMCKYNNEKICNHGDLNQGPLEMGDTATVPQSQVEFQCSK